MRSPRKLLTFHTDPSTIAPPRVPTLVHAFQGFVEPVAVFGRQPITFGRPAPPNSWRPSILMSCSTTARDAPE